MALAQSLLKTLLKLIKAFRIFEGIIFEGKGAIFLA
jgi:hypothetical protein